MSEIKATDYFAIIPETVLLAPISSNAVRLYGILNRFANSSGKAWPSRKTLAEMMDVSVATIDRAKDELVELGALHVENRLGPNGDLTSNVYTLVMSSPMTKGSVTGDGRGSPKDDALNKANMKQSQLQKSATKTTTSIACGTCVGKYRNGYDDGTEGLSHIWETFESDFPGQGTKTVGRYIVCPSCDGTGVAA